MVGVAIGSMGMSLSTLERLTPERFMAAWRAWRAGEELRLKTSWEQTRWLGVMSIAPWSKKAMKAQDLLPLPWDKTEAEEPEERAAESPEEKERRVAALIERLGMRRK